MEENKPQRILVFVFLCIAFGSFFVFAQPTSTTVAQQPTPSDDEVNAIANQLFCPVCENIPLDVCDTQACRQWRDLIRQMLAEGKSEQEIKQYFTDNYGVRVLAEPPAEGFNWLVHVIPPVAFIIGVYLLFRAFLSWKRIARENEYKSEPENTPTFIDDTYTTRFEEELKKRK